MKKTPTSELFFWVFISLLFGLLVGLFIYLILGGIDVYQTLIGTILLIFGGFGGYWINWYLNLRGKKREAKFDGMVFLVRAQFLLAHYSSLARSLKNFKEGTRDFNKFNEGIIKIFFYYLKQRIEPLQTLINKIEIKLDRLAYIGDIGGKEFDMIYDTISHNQILLENAITLCENLSDLNKKIYGVRKMEIWGEKANEEDIWLFKTHIFAHANMLLNASNFVMVTINEINQDINLDISKGEKFHKNVLNRLEGFKELDEELGYEPKTKENLPSK